MGGTRGGVYNVPRGQSRDNADRSGDPTMCLSLYALAIFARGIP